MQGISHDLAAIHEACLADQSELLALRESSAVQTKLVAALQEHAQALRSENQSLLAILDGRHKDAAEEVTVGGQQASSAQGSSRADQAHEPCPPATPCLLPAR